ncbi:MAG TPA: hypothetical protein VME19_14920 [Streptosporangiaceae bacterium]|nr:hypothetical protein [Streptosporangiaceae bacterium]
MTREPTDHCGADGTGGRSRPLGRRRPRAGRDPQPPAGLPPAGPPSRWPAGNYGTVPGYEFEGRRSPAARDARPAGQESRSPRSHDPSWLERPAPEPAWGDPGDEPPRFRYTQTVSHPPAVPPQAWTDRPAVVPGFEFERPAATPGPFLGDQFPPPTGLRAPPGPAQTGPAPPGPAQAGPAQAGRAQAGRARVPQARLTRTAALRPDLGSARAEWARLLHSFVPQPIRRSWFSRFAAALEFRGALLRVVLPVLSMIVIGVAVVVVVDANSGRSSPAPAPTSLGFPPAILAGGDFTAAATGRGIDQTLGRVASDGSEIVAVGSQTGARIARAQFFVSLNGGGSWSMAAVRAPDGGPPPPGYAARLVAGGHGAWVALGPSSIWTSLDGRTWTLASTAGLPLRPGDQISVLKRTAGGFIVAGSNVPGGDAAKASPVVFLSANGISWQRLDAAQLGLAAGTGRVLGIRYAAAYRNLILIAGDVAQPVTGRSGRTATVRTSAAWLSSDGGTTWTLAVRPGAAVSGPGAQPQISGEAVTSQGFILARPAIVGRRPAVDVYRSANGTAWTFGATLGTPAGFEAGFTSGGPAGAVVTGQAGGALTAFVSANGASWRQTAAFGSPAGETVSGVTMAAGGTLVVTGTTARDPDGPQPMITVLGAQAVPVRVDVPKIPGAVDPELAVNGIAAGGSTLVAVGSANGFPAAWTSANGGGGWARAVGQTPAVFARPGNQELNSVTYGPAGWLAVGGVTGGAAQHPVVVSSATGSSWQAADAEGAFRGPGLFTEEAAAGPGGYVIVGFQVISGRPVAAAWWSAGLTGWRRAGDAAPGALDGAGADEQMLAVTAGPRGFVAVGADGDRPSAWTSPDGQAWTAVVLPLPIGTRRAELQHVASDGRAVAAVGTMLTTAGQVLPFAASSSDGGATWTETALPVPKGQTFVTALSAAGNSFTATGTFGRTPGHQDVVVWTSADGSAWQEITPTGRGLAGPGIQVITALTASGGTLTGVGFTASPAGEEPLFWQSPVR